MAPALYVTAPALTLTCRALQATIATIGVTCVTVAAVTGEPVSLAGVASCTCCVGRNVTKTSCRLLWTVAASPFGMHYLRDTNLSLA